MVAGGGLRCIDWDRVELHGERGLHLAPLNLSCHGKKYARFYRRARVRAGQLPDRMACVVLQIAI